MVRQHPAYACGRAVAFVADASKDALTAPGGPVPAASVDYATMVFVLSALAPEAMPQVRRCVGWLVLSAPALSKQACAHAYMCGACLTVQLHTPAE